MPTGRAFITLLLANTSSFVIKPLYRRPFIFAMSTLSESPTVVSAPASMLPSWMPANRTKLLTHNVVKPSDPSKNKSIVYWMQRDVRARDNWALLWAAHLAQQFSLNLHVVYALPPASTSPTPSDDLLPPPLETLRQTERSGKFLLGGLELVHKELKAQKIPLHVVMSKSNESVPASVCDKISECQAELVVADFSALRHHRIWLETGVAPKLEQQKIPVYQVDAHNVVPVWVAAPHRQVGARTLRPRINKLLNDYMKHEYPELNFTNGDEVVLPEFDMKSYISHLQWDDSVKSVEWHKPGTDEGMLQLQRFFQTGLKDYDTLRNNPLHPQACSDMSPWINHGHVSFQRIVEHTKVLRKKYANATASFLEEGVIRRELSDNMLYYSPNNYDSLETAAGWAQETLQTHASDKREYVYTFTQLRDGHTHDDLWNAAQLQLVREGRMHGFLRMYWAKKILEWTESPETALSIAQFLNDYYALDGRDPNGFVGVGWSIMGIHDQGWKEREVFGKIRFMNYKGCQRKFKVAEFVARYSGAAENASGTSSAKRKKDGQGELTAFFGKKKQRKS